MQISWRTRADNPHEHDPRYGYVGIQLRFLVVHLGGDSWFATDRIGDANCGGVSFMECVKWCWSQLGDYVPDDVAGHRNEGSGV